MVFSPTVVVNEMLLDYFNSISVLDGNLMHYNKDFQKFILTHTLGSWRRSIWNYVNQISVVQPVLMSCEDGCILLPSQYNFSNLYFFHCRPVWEDGSLASSAICECL